VNTGIREARGRYIAILGAHCDYASDYLRVCAALLDEHPEAGCVGGPIVSGGKSLFGQAVAAAMSHPVGIGNARHRHPDFEGYAEGACFPVLRREVFEKVGLYDEMLVRNQDDELNYRFTKQRGERCFFLPVRAQRTACRETVKSLFRQYFRYGYWRVAVLRRHRVPASFRQIVPPLFMSLMACSVIVGLLLPGWWKLMAGILPVLYGVALLIAGVTQKGNHDWRVAALFPSRFDPARGLCVGGLRGIIKGTDRSRQSERSDKGTCSESGS
jgi:GT2 family glycosyltransferase